MARVTLPEPPADGPLLAAAAAGDRAAFDTLVDRHKLAVFHHVRRRVRDQHAAEDLTQETFLRAFRAARNGAYTGQAKLTTWLLTIAGNVTTDHLRATARRPTVPLADGPSPTSDRPDQLASVREGNVACVVAVVDGDAIRRRPRRRSRLQRRFDMRDESSRHMCEGTPDDPDRTARHPSLRVYPRTRAG